MSGKKGRVSKENPKNCVLCGKEFIPKVWNSTVCEDEHYKTCEYCGEKYELKKDEKVKSLLERKSCYKEDCVKKWKLESKKKRVYYNKCIICGKEFKTYFYNVNICDKEHHRTCSICKEDFILKQEAHVERVLDRDFCYKKECIKTHKGNLIKNNENCQKTFINNQIFKKKCIICGKEFESNSSKRLICDKEHKRICKYCNSEFIIRNTYLTGHKVKSGRQYNRDYCYNQDCINKSLSDKTKETSLIRYGTEYAMQTDEFKEKSKNTRLEKYGSYLNQETLRFEIISEQNKEFSDLLNLYSIDNEFEFSLDSKSYDIHILNSNILIEIDPVYTHNSTIGPVFKGNHRGIPRQKDYHINKTKLAVENGYRCIHIWDWDDKKKIAYLLRTKSKLSGHKTHVKEVDKQQCDEFLNQYHLQNTCRGQDIRIGLFKKDNNELLSVITFGKPRYNKNYEYEFLRYASSDYVVHGGLRKMWDYFIKEYNPNSIISYCDNSKFDGTFFKYLDFSLIDYGHPTCHWYRKKGKLHYTDNLLRQRGADKLLGTNYGRPEVCNMNNKQIMIKEGFVEIYDCGQSTWVWNRT